MKKSLISIILIVCALVAGVLVGMLLAGGRNSGKGAKGDKISQTMSLIRQFYVDPVDMDSLADVTIPLILEELDPHSIYIPASEFQAVNEPMEGHFDGVGVVFNMFTDTVVVIKVIPLGPSDKMGVQAGDRIIKINDTLVAGQGIGQDRIVKRLRGPRDTKVKISIERRGAPGLTDIEITRGVIPVNALDAAFMIKPGIGFVKLSAFSKVSYSELYKALAGLQAQGMKKLIFDLRDNAGGYFDQAINIANMFLGSGELIVYTQDRAREKVEQFSNGQGGFTGMPLVVLINEESASSSEILAGAIQDNDRGWIVGRRSYGKGLVQGEMPYSDGSVLRLTTARYYTPSGRSIQKPYDRGAEAYKMDLVNRILHNELLSADSIRQDSVRYFTRQGRVVHGGGGIMPDYFVPIDTISYTPYYLRVNGANLNYRFALKWGDDHRAQVNAVQTVDDLNKMLRPYSARLVDEFVAYAARNGVKPNYKQIATSRRLMEAQLRAFIGTNTALDYTGFYAEIYPIDPTIVKALEVLDN